MAEITASRYRGQTAGTDSPKFYDCRFGAGEGRFGERAFGTACYDALF